ncbi:toll/interleukin-1 receptor domain-containing protein [Pseudomonas knackmussii]|uniref:toll/interleukin-1 receptor domain-containing protein n=1 Tax=Pseudomonas knackmussii TaxID=65741 RepID=UPI003F49CBF0
MSRIFLSYSRHDKDIVLSVSRKLQSLGHEITVDVDSVLPGQDWRKVLATGLRDSEVYVVFLSKNSLASASVLSEVGAARAYSEESGRMLVIPVLIEDVQIPSSINDVLVLSALNTDATTIALKIEAAIAHFVGARIAKDDQQESFSKIIEENSANYIEEAIDLQQKSEKRNRRAATAWYVAGFASLLGGLAFVGYSVSVLVLSEATNWADFAILSLKSFLVVGILGACSKYAFTLGKSYMSEALKSADRIHAISFGKFYLKVYGAKATWPEVREAFQHWNIDRTSVFSSLGTTEFDPKLMEGLLELGKSFASRSGERK